MKKISELYDNAKNITVSDAISNALTFVWKHPVSLIPLGGAAGALLAVGSLAIHAANSGSILYNDPEQMKYLNDILEGLKMTYQVEAQQFGSAGAVTGAMLALPISAIRKTKNIISEATDASVEFAKDGAHFSTKTLPNATISAGKSLIGFAIPTMITGLKLLGKMTGAAGKKVTDRVRDSFKGKESEYLMVDEEGNYSTMNLRKLSAAAKRGADVSVLNTKEDKIYKKSIREDGVSSEKFFLREGNLVSDADLDEYEIESNYADFSNR